MSSPGDLIFQTKKYGVDIGLYNPVSQYTQQLIVIKKGDYFRTMPITRDKADKIIEGNFDIEAIYIPEIDADEYKFVFYE